jgi:hypothetical protein
MTKFAMRSVLEVTFAVSRRVRVRLDERMLPARTPDALRSRL